MKKNILFLFTIFSYLSITYFSCKSPDLNNPYQIAFCYPLIISRIAIKTLTTKIECPLKGMAYFENAETGGRMCIKYCKEGEKITKNGWTPSCIQKGNLQ